MECAVCSFLVQLGVGEEGSSSFVPSAPGGLWRSERLSVPSISRVFLAPMAAQGMQVASSTPVLPQEGRCPWHLLLRWLISICQR